MHAAVEQQMDLAVLFARDDHRLQFDPARYIVAGLGNLAFMSDVYPVAIPDLFQFLVEYRWIVIDSSADAIVLNQVVIVGLHGKHRRHPTAAFGHIFRSSTSRAGSRNGSKSSSRAAASTASSNGSRKTERPLRASRIMSRGPLPRSSRPTSTAANSLVNRSIASPLRLLAAMARSETSSWASARRC